MTFHLARALLRYVQTHQKYPPSTGHGVAKAASGWDEIAQTLAAATTNLSSPMVSPTGKQCETRWGTYRCTIAPRMAMVLYNTAEQAMKTYYAQHHRDEDMDDVIEVWKTHFKLVEGFYPLIVDNQSDVIPRELREQLHEILQHQQDQEENDMTIYRIGREVYDICLRNRVDLNEKARSKTANRLKHRTKRDLPDMTANSDQSALPSAESTENKKTAKRQKRNAVQSMESSQGVPSLALPTLPSLPYDDDTTGNTVDNGENNTLSSNTSSSALYHSSSDNNNNNNNNNIINNNNSDTTSDIIASFNETLIAVAGDIINAIYSIKQKPRITDRFPTLNEWFRLLQLNDNEINTVSRQYQLLDITHIYGCNDVTMLMSAGIPKHKAMRWVHEADRYE